ncbi:MAG: VOC family protein [Anaerolineae bacterium]
MFKVTQYPHGTFCWADGMSHDQKKADEFYAGVLGWQVLSVPISDEDTYSMYQKDGEDVAGLGQMSADMIEQGIPSHWNNYVNVTDVDALADKVTELGGTLIAPPFDVMDNGRMLVLQDPTGATLGLWQGKSHIGAGLVNTVGAMCWNELATRDIEKAQAFYGALLGWEFQKEENQDYYTILNQGRMNGGMLPIDESWGEAPAMWNVYFTVADIEESVKQVEQHGGKLIMPVTPSMAGKFAFITDNTGAMLYFLEAGERDAWIE